MLHLSVKEEDHAFAMPSLVAHKQRKLELRAGRPPARGRKGASASYSLKEVRAAEREFAQRSEQAYQAMVTNWRPKPPAAKRSAQLTSAPRSGRGRQHRDTTMTP